jgi:hypothetical protein
MLIFMSDNLQNLRGKLMSNNRQNLVSLDQWKHQKRESSFSEYLKVLSFNDLINESTLLSKEIKRQAAADHLLSKTKLMMNELKSILDGYKTEKAHRLLGGLLMQYNELLRFRSNYRNIRTIVSFLFENNFTVC